MRHRGGGPRPGGPTHSPTRAMGVISAIAWNLCPGCAPFQQKPITTCWMFTIVSAQSNRNKQITQNKKTRTHVGLLTQLLNGDFGFSSFNLTLNVLWDLCFAVSVYNILLQLIRILFLVNKSLKMKPKPRDNNKRAPLFLSFNHRTEACAVVFPEGRRQLLSYFRLRHFP